MKLKNKVISLLLVFCLVMGFMPTPAFAAGTGKAIQLGTDALSTNVNTTSAAKVYFGKNARNQPYAYYVIGYKSTGVPNLLNDYGAALLGVEGYDTTRFDTNSEDYATSLLKETMYTIAWKLTDGEKKAIRPRTLNNSNAHYFDPPYSNTISGDKVPDALIWPLSTYEANLVDPSVRKLGVNPDVQTSDWWLRSPGLNFDMFSGSLRNAAYVTSDGNLRPLGASISNDYAVRPAFYLNLSYVLFTFAAQGGKPSGKIGELLEVPDYDGNEWRLTLKDYDRLFTARAIEPASVSSLTGGSVQITYRGARTGNNEFVSVLLCDNSGTVLYYGNIAHDSEYGTAKLTIPAGLAPGDYTLKVFSEQYNGFYYNRYTDYASPFQDISLKILPPAETPNASFTATSDNGGTLSNVDTNMRYSVDGGETWNNITGTTMEITDVREEKDVKVYRIGDGTNTADSAVQTIDVTQAVISDEIIDKINIKNCTTSDQNDGQVTGVDNTMEYAYIGYPSAVSPSVEWVEITGDTLTGLTRGVYLLRIKANGTQLASFYTNFIIDEHTCVAQEGWKSDGNYHWKECECGTELEKAAHSGGKATCTVSAVCEVCGQPYGSVDSTNHTGSEAWTTTETSHTKVWSCCQAIIEEPAEHTWENG